MDFQKTTLDDAYVIELNRLGDERGFFARAFCDREFTEMGLANRFVQVNNSLSANRGTLRGLHYQLSPDAETKLVRCIRGALYDVIVDLRPESNTYLQHLGIELTAENRKMLYVPKGFAHGFITLESDTEAFYFVDQYYAPESERGLRWNDPALSIDWPMRPVEISDKDANHPDFDPRHHLPPNSDV